MFDLLKAVYHGHHDDPRCARLLGKTALVREPEAAYAYRDDAWLVQFDDVRLPEAFGWTLFPRSYFTVYPPVTLYPYDDVQWYPPLDQIKSRGVL